MTADRLSRDITLAPPASPSLLSRPAGAVASVQPLVALSGSTASAVVGPTINVVWEELFADEWGIAQLAGACSLGSLDPTWESTARRIDAPAGGPTGRNALSPAIAAWSDDHPAVHLVFREVSDTGQRVMYATSSSNGSGGWSTPVALGSAVRFAGAPVICTQEIGGNRFVFVAWTEHAGATAWSGEEGLRLAVSSDGGLNFGAPLVVSTPNGRALRPAIAPGVTSGDAYLSWISYDDDLTTGGYRANLQRWDASGSAGTLHVYTPGSFPVDMTELQLVTVPSRQGALMVWAEDGNVQGSLWYRDTTDTVDLLAALTGPGPTQGEADHALDESAGLVMCVFSQSANTVADPLLAWSRVLDLSPLPTLPPVWSASLQPISTQGASKSLIRPRIAVSGGDALVVWMQPAVGPGADYDIMASTSLVSLTPSWSTPVSISSQPATLPGHAQARSGYPRLVLEPGRAVVVWDDRRDWSTPDPVTNAPLTSALGAPDVHATLVDL